MIDEMGNDCPYDFKNILFSPYNIEAKTYFTYTFNSINDSNGSDTSLNNSNVVNNIIKPYYNGLLIDLNYILIVGSAKSNYFNTDCK
jgi:hypothetical protein